MLPILINEHLTHSFNFYLDNQIQQGMRHGQELYRLVCEYRCGERLQAYQQACELIEKGGEVMVSASPVRYAVWMSLRSPVSPSLQPPSRAQPQGCAV